MIKKNSAKGSYAVVVFRGSRTGNPASNVQLGNHQICSNLSAAKTLYEQMVQDWKFRIEGCKHLSITVQVWKLDPRPLSGRTTDNFTVLKTKTIFRRAEDVIFYLERNR